jgi:hypothetical protein
MPIHAAIALKVEQDMELANQHATNSAASELDHIERALAATGEKFARLVAEFVHTRQVAQHTVDLEAGRVAALSKTAEKKVKKETETKAKKALLHHQRHVQKMQKHKHYVAAAAATTIIVAKASAIVVSSAATTVASTATAQPVGNQLPFQAPPPSHGSTSTGDRESTPRSRSEEPQRPRSGRFPWGKAQFAYAALTKEV